ncbi:hypothetical protein PspLS_11264 [Pyricularia sp. CBS 133598]|nr:hypothetical protein PspLS_11264 [Pyricularia sp. CBS 133598]
MLISTYLAIFASTAALVTAQNTGGDGGSSVQLTTVTLPTLATASGTVTSPIQTGCPTATATGIQCSTCIVPACLRISTITQSCGCPTPVPTQTLDWPCEGGCSGLSCSTSYVVAQLAIGCPSNGSTSLLPPTQLPPSSGLPTTTPDGQVSTSSDSGPGPTAAVGRIMPFKFWM